MFDAVRAEYQTDADRHLHIGDNPHSDVDQQVRGGGIALHVPRPTRFPGPGEFDRQRSARVLVRAGPENRRALAGDRRPFSKCRQDARADGGRHGFACGRGGDRFPSRPGPLPEPRRCLPPPGTPARRACPEAGRPYRRYAAFTSRRVAFPLSRPRSSPRSGTRSTACGRCIRSSRYRRC